MPGSVSDKSLELEDLDIVPVFASASAFSLFSLFSLSSDSFSRKSIHKSANDCIPKKA
jgi:hypothetical protein